MSEAGPFRKQPMGLKMSLTDYFPLLCVYSLSDDSIPKCQIVSAS
jgi:hypothetical protein